MMIRPESRSDVSGWPTAPLRFEGAALLAAASFAYWRLGASWGRFAPPFLIPDLSLLGYLVGPRVGAIGCIGVGASYAPR